MLGGDVDFHEGLSPLRHLGLHSAGGVHRLTGHGLKALNVCNQGFGFLRLIDVPAIIRLDGLRRAVHTLPGLCTGRGIIFIPEPLHVVGHLRCIDGDSQALTAIYPGCDRQAIEDFCLVVRHLVGDAHAVHAGELLTDDHGLRRGYGALIDRIHIDGYTAASLTVLRPVHRLILRVCRSRSLPRTARRKARSRKGGQLQHRAHRHNRRQIFLHALSHTFPLQKLPGHTSREVHYLYVSESERKML